MLDICILSHFRSLDRVFVNRINKDHAVIENIENRRLFIRNLGDSKLLLNGKTVNEDTKLHHNDRWIICGAYLVAIIPGMFSLDLVMFLERY